MYSPKFADFEVCAKRGNLIPVYREILADLETPVSVLKKIRHKRHAYLLESVEGGEKWGRYSFIGTNAEIVFRIRGPKVILEEKGKIFETEHRGDPLGRMREHSTNQYRMKHLRIYNL